MMSDTIICILYEARFHRGISKCPRRSVARLAKYACIDPLTTVGDALKHCTPHRHKQTCHLIPQYIQDLDRRILLIFLYSLFLKVSNIIVYSMFIEEDVSIVKVKSVSKPKNKIKR